MASKLEALNQWVDEVAQRARPDHIHWCDGSDIEYQSLVTRMLEADELVELDQDAYPGCYLHRTRPDDVVAPPERTRVCSPKREDAGGDNHWQDPVQAHQTMDGLFDGCMQGRTMYVIAYCLGPIGSALARCGVQITDSPWVVALMRTMTRMGKAALERIERDRHFVRCLHATGDLDPSHRWLMHFPAEELVQSFGSNHAAHAMLARHGHALRIASVQAHAQGWLAEHMLILGVGDPHGEIRYLAIALPPADSPLDLSMLVPPPQYRKDGWKIWTVGDEICWLAPGSDGCLWAINPLAGHSGRLAGIQAQTQPDVLEMLQHDTLFVDAALTKDMQPWWEGLDDRVPARDWRGHEAVKGKPAAHPDARFVVASTQCPSWSPEAESAPGVPISAIVFCSERNAVLPLVREARNWSHGVLMGASMAADGDDGTPRRDPMAMRHLCGYDLGEYLAHWLSFDRAGLRLPRIFQINTFRTDDDGSRWWPGQHENLRVFEWILQRLDRKVAGRATAIGTLPAEGEINTDGLALADGAMAEMLDIDTDGWKRELAALDEYLDRYGEHGPKAMKAELKRELDALDERGP